MNTLQQCRATVWCHHIGPIIIQCPEKQYRQYFGRNFYKFSQLLTIFGTNHPDIPRDWKIVKYPINICTTIRNDDVIVTSLKSVVFARRKRNARIHNASTVTSNWMGKAGSHRHCSCCASVAASLSVYVKAGGGHFQHGFYRVMRCKRGLCCHAVSVCLSVCPSVCPSVTFVDHVKTNKDIFEMFSPSSSDTILVFLSQRGCWYSDGNPLTWASNARGMTKWRFFHKYLAVSQKRL